MRDHNELRETQFWAELLKQLCYRTLAVLQRDFDSVDPFAHFSWSDRYQFEAEVAVGFFVDSFKTHGIFEADPARFGWLDETEILYQEDARLENCLGFDALQLAGKGGRKRVPEVGGQCRRADH